MIGLQDQIEVGLMTRETVTRGRYITCCMTGNAVESHVRAGQGKLRRAVIKCAWCPSARRVTRYAIVIEVIQNVIGVTGGGKIAAMT